MSQQTRVTFIVGHLEYEVFTSEWDEDSNEPYVEAVTVSLPGKAEVFYLEEFQKVTSDHYRATIVEPVNALPAKRVNTSPI